MGKNTPQRNGVEPGSVAQSRLWPSCHRTGAQGGPLVAFCNGSPHTTSPILLPLTLTHVTFVWLFFGVYFQVCHQIACIGRFEVTVVAFIQLLQWVPHCCLLPPHCLSIILHTGTIALTRFDQSNPFKDALSSFIWQHPLLHQNSQKLCFFLLLCN